jgi:hypothetical protein
MCDDCPRIDKTQPYGAHIDLTCKNHPGLRWSTKNIRFIGARSIFFDSRSESECECPASDLIVAPHPDPAPVSPDA